MMSYDLSRVLDRSILPLASLGLPVFALLFWIFAGYVRVLKLRQRLPPGPFPLPLFGNHFSIPKSKPWIKFAEWSKQYNNPLLTVWVGRRPFIYCNDAETATDLMEKRAEIYSGRPQMIIMGDARLSVGNDQVALGYNDQWRAHRKLMHTAVGVQAVKGHRHAQINEGKILLRDLLTIPEDYVNSIERYSCSVVSIIGWGRRITSITDPIATTALKFMESVNMILPGLYMAETIPELAYLPRWLYGTYKDIGVFATGIYKYFYAVAREGSQAQEDNFAKRLIAEQKKLSLKNVEVATLTTNLIGGGVDTTSSTIISAILALCVFPEVQKKAQAELDAVVGQGRFPSFEDEASLPYINALVKEILRWRSVAILSGIPHAPIQDDIYRGYFIPKGTHITGNLWAIHRNEKDFPRPDEIVPERFFKDSPEYRPYPNAFKISSFGFGKRICSGQPLALQGLFITIARLIWAFEIRPNLLPDGTEEKLDIFAYTDSENMRPQEFGARFIVRSDEIKQMILSEAEEAQAELAPLEGTTNLTLGQFLQSGKAW